MILYVPATAKTTGGIPTLMWCGSIFRRMGSMRLIRFDRIHGGSFVEGSATDFGLDGSPLAEATGSIVAVMQYRLGAVCYPINYNCMYSSKAYPARVHGT
jgi:hypothetical protein